jgi:hypothetical protein
MLRKEAVSSGLLNVLLRLAKLPVLSNHRLVGGTALALQIGHRISIDLDLFCDTNSDYAEIEKIIQKEFGSQLTIERTINSTFGKGICLTIDGIKTDIIDWKNPFTFPPINIENISLASKEEILRMKLDIITSPAEFARYDKKDFVDLAFLLNEYPLSKMIKMYSDYHPQIKEPARIIIEALHCAELADKKPNPNMLIALSWNDVKHKIQGAINDYLQSNFE